MLPHGLLFSIILLSALQPGSAQETNNFFSVQLENDLWGSNDDRYYTHGTKLSWASNEPAPGFLKRPVERMPFYSVGETEYHGYEFGQAIFTPEDIEQAGLIENDRPYAGWLYLNTGIGSFYYDRGDRDRLNMLLLTIGIVGPSALAEETQEAVHSVFGATNPEGWDNQLEDELGLNATFVNKWRRIYDFDEPRQRELSLHYNLALGNVYTYAAAGFQLRYGTHLKTDIGPPSILPGFPGAPAFNPNLQSNWYFFGGIEVRLMARNVFLDGNTIRDSHSVVKEPFVADLQFGFAYHFSDMRISFVQLIRSREFEGQDKLSQYGAINFTLFSE